MSASKPKRIMVVDDDVDILNIVQKSLRKWDLNSDGYTSARAALEHFRHNSDLYALVISDLKMEEMHGFHFLEQLIKIKPDVRVIVVTAFFRDMLDIPEVLKGIVRVDSVLEKPFGIKKICERVRAQLNMT